MLVSPQRSWIFKVLNVRLESLDFLVCSREKGMLPIGILLLINIMNHHLCAYFKSNLHNNAEKGADVIPILQMGI